jgi:hypothetical protein
MHAEYELKFYYSGVLLLCSFDRITDCTMDLDG